MGIDFSKLVGIDESGKRLVDGAGEPFFVVGVNYVGSPDRAWNMWRDGKFDLRLIERDFRRAMEAGANAIRLFVRSPLPHEIASGRWGKLDGVVELARREGLYLIVTLADYPIADVAGMADFAGRVAARYRGDSTILAFDLKNEPHYSDLATMRYPSTPSLQTDLLIRHYGERIGRTDAVRWGREGHAPGYLTDDELYFYANGLEVRRDFLRAEVDWVRSKKFTATIADYIRSPEARPWRTFLNAVNETLVAWMKPQIEAVRAADGRRLITLGWSDAMLASLSANEMLDIISMHVYLRSYPPARSTLFRFRMRLLDALQVLFPRKPLLLEEFGYATHKMPEGWAAVAEGATWLYLLSSGAAGGAKWMLVDLPRGSNPEERTLGLYRSDMTAKPSAYATSAIGEYATLGSPGGSLSLGEEDGNLVYRFEAGDARFFSGKDHAGDELVSIDGNGPVQLFAWWRHPGRIKVVATSEGVVKVKPSDLIGVTPSATFDLLGSTSRPLEREGVFSFRAEPGQEIEVRLRYDEIDAKIEIVWPHGGAPVDKADKANITAYLFYHGSRLSVPCEFDGKVHLWAAVNNEPMKLVSTGVRRMAEFEGRIVPVWDFNDVDVSAARKPANKIYFQVRADGGLVFSNVWVHGIDARTRMPHPMEPVDVLETPPESVDARIQIVWPHDDAPVEEATLANVTVALFAHKTVASVPLDWSPKVVLYRALNSDVGSRIGVGTKRIVESEGRRYPVWDFNDVDVSTARDVKSKIHFWAEVEGVPTYPAFWTHGADARTYFPEPDIPLGDCR